MITHMEQAAPVAEWLRLRIFSALNCSSHCCGFDPSSGHMRQAKFWVGGQVVFLGDLTFSPHLTIDLDQNK